MRKYLAIIILFASGFQVVKSAGPIGSYVGYTHCAEQDSLALVAFYYATGGPNWRRTTDTAFSISSLASGDDYGAAYYLGGNGWDWYPNAGTGKWLEGPVKDWFGVLLEKQQVGNTTDSVWRVIHLTPVYGRRTDGNNNMVGYLPKELGYLTALQYFRVNGNVGLGNQYETGKYPGDIPAEVYHPTLTKIDIENDWFTGIIDPAFRKCTNISELCFRYNHIDSMPTLDFLTQDHLLNNMAHMFFYNTWISYATMEKSVDYFATFSTAQTINYQIQKQDNVGREYEIVAKPGDNVVLTCNEAGVQGTCTWTKKGINTYKTGTTYTITNIAAKDTGIYRGVIANPYVAAWQKESATDVGNVLTKPIHVVFTPSTPVCKFLLTSYSGNEVELTFNKAMAIPTTAQASQFSVASNGVKINVIDIKRTGRLYNKYILKLASSIFKDETVTISYTPGSIVDSNGGVLLSFSDKAVQNLTRSTPNVINNAITRKDGAGIVVNFDQFIDQNTFVASDFTITQSDDPTQKVVGVALNPGEIDDNISKSITLVLANSIIDSTVTIKVSYIKGSLTALYGGAVQSFNLLSVKNIASGKSTPVTLHFNDYCKRYSNIYVKGTIKSLPFKLYDDNTNGDAVANDNNWTKSVRLSTGEFTWGVYQRTISAYDTTVTTDEITGIQTVILTPKPDATIDSLLSPVMSLIVVDTIIGNDTVSIVRGDTIVYICDKSVTIILDMKSYSAKNPAETINPYLMGINDDWQTGIEMIKIKDPLNNDSVYAVTISGLNTGDLINFNFKNENEWENISADSRHYTISGVDTIRAEFKVFPVSIQGLKEASLIIYPNPAHDRLYIAKTNKISFKAAIYSQLGQCLIVNSGESTIDISHLNAGIYILKLIDKDGNQHRRTFIKR